MSDQVDRIDAEEVSSALGICVSAVPEDFDALTAALWTSTFGEAEQMPESPATRWELLAQAIAG